MARIKLFIVLILAVIILWKREKFFLALLGIIAFAVDGLKSVFSTFEQRTKPVQPATTVD